MFSDILPLLKRGEVNGMATPHIRLIGQGEAVTARRKLCVSVSKPRTTHMHSIHSIHSIHHMQILTQHHLRITAPSTRYHIPVSPLTTTPTGPAEWLRPPVHSNQYNQGQPRPGSAAKSA